MRRQDVMELVKVSENAYMRQLVWFRMLGTRPLERGCDEPWPRLHLALIFATVLLTGCVDKFAQFYSDIPQYKGQKIDALIDRIGYPDSQTLAAGRVVYTWMAASAVQMDLRPMQAPPIGAPYTPFHPVSSAPEAVNLRFRCTLQVETDGTGTILRLSWVGKPGDCAP